MYCLSSNIYPKKKENGGASGDRTHVLELHFGFNPNRHHVIAPLIYVKKRIGRLSYKDNCASCSLSEKSCSSDHTALSFQTYRPMLPPLVVYRSAMPCASILRFG